MVGGRETINLLFAIGKFTFVVALCYLFIIHVEIFNDKNETKYFVDKSNVCSPLLTVDFCVDIKGHLRE
jgi:hypothetical protein